MSQDLELRTQKIETRAPWISTRETKFPALTHKFLCLLVSILMVIFLLGDQAIGADSANYILLSRSILFDNDLFLANDLRELGKPIFVTKTGFPLETHNFGVAMFWLPFYIAGHLLTLLADKSGNGVAADGLRSSYIIWLRFADLVYGIIALRLITSVLMVRVSESTARLAVSAVAIGGGFLAYMGLFSPSSHAVSVFLAALFLYLWLKKDGPSAKRWALLGLIAGAALWVASTNIALLGVPGVHFLRAARQRKALGHAALFALGYTLGFLPQMLAWWLLMGNPLQSPYSAQLSWQQPNVWATLTSSYQGLIPFTPLLAFALLGLRPLWQKERGLALGGSLSILGALYISASNSAWWGGSSFGVRYMLGVLPIFALALAHLIDAAPNFIARLLVIPIIAISTLWSLSLLLAYTLGGASLGQYYFLSELVFFAGRGIRLMPTGIVEHLRTVPVLLWLFSPLLVLLLTMLLQGLPHLPERLAHLLARPIALPIIATLLILASAVLTARSLEAKTLCHQSDCKVGWIASEIDQWDWAGTLYEEALYYAKRGEREKARRSQAAMLAVYPTNAYAELWNQAIEEALAP